MDFENLFSKPPNPALGKKAEERVDCEVKDTKVEKIRKKKIKRKVKLSCEQIPKKFRHFGNSAASPKSLARVKSRSRDYDPYSDTEVCGQEPEDSFAQELRQYIQAKEMASAAQASPAPAAPLKKEGAEATPAPAASLKKEGAEASPPVAKQKKKNPKANHKNLKQKKMKRKWPGASAPQGQDGEPKEKQQCVRMSQEFINQHTVEQKGKQVCKYFLERKCIKGDQCKFDHDAEIKKKREMCKFYVQGYCTKGENCLYLHNEYPCKFYHTGTKCYQGDNCNFSHAPLTAETQELLARVLDTEKKSCK